MIERFPTVPPKRPPRTLSPTDLEFCIWAGEAFPGEQVFYHRGFLAIDTCPQASSLDRGARARLQALAESARWASDAKLVHLVQRRIGDDCYAYVAIARPKPLAHRIELAELIGRREAA